MDTISAPLASIGIDIGKEVFHIVGFGTDGKIAFRRNVRARNRNCCPGIAIEKLSAVYG
jgi:hypothetical protein